MEQFTVPTTEHNVHGKVNMLEKRLEKLERVIQYLCHNDTGAAFEALAEP